MTDANKWLYSFEVEKKYNGNSITVYLKKPTRQIKEDGEIYLAQRISNYIKSGIAPRAVLERQYEALGGLESEEQKKEYAEKTQRLVSLEEQIKILAADIENTEVNKPKMLDLIQEATIIRGELLQRGNEKIMAFSNCAEALARNYAILWFLTKLAYWSVNGDEPKKVFTGKNVGEDFDEYEDITMGVRDDEFWKNVLPRLYYLTTVWYVGTANNFDQFIELDRYYKETVPFFAPEPVAESDTNVDDTPSNE